MAGKQSTCRSALKSQATVVLHLEYRHTEGTKGKRFQSSKSLSKEIHQSASSYFFPLLLASHCRDFNNSPKRRISYLWDSRGCWKKQSLHCPPWKLTQEWTWKNSRRNLTLVKEIWRHKANWQSGKLCEYNIIWHINTTTQHSGTWRRSHCP